MENEWTNEPTNATQSFTAMRKEAGRKASLYGDHHYEDFGLDIQRWFSIPDSGILSERCWIDHREQQHVNLRVSIDAPSARSLDERVPCAEPIILSKPYSFTFCPLYDKDPLKLSTWILWVDGVYFFS